MFKLGQLINDFSSGVNGGSYLANPIYTSLVIVSIIFVILYLMSYDSIEFDEDESYSGIFAKSAFFAILATVSILFISFNHIKTIYRNKYSSKDTSEIVQLARGDLVETVTPT